jgi:hypothetical protein
MISDKDPPAAPLWSRASRGFVNECARRSLALYTDRHQLAIDQQGRYGLELQALHQGLPLGLIHIDDLDLDAALLGDLLPHRFGPAARWAPIRYQ